MINSFSGKLGHWNSVNTDDGSTTLYSEYFDENCHSLSGARLETVFQYIDGCKITSINNPRILEIGFGTGIGFEETYKALHQLRSFHFTSLELDSALVDWFVNNTILDLNLNFRVLDTYAELKTTQFDLKIVFGDARDSIKTLPDNYFNGIYLDAFSPKKNPSLWTVEWLKELYRVSTEDCILSTYCSSIGFRKALLESNWKIYEGGSFGKKKTSTRAIKTGKTNAEILEKLNQSKIPAFKD